MAGTWTLTTNIDHAYRFTSEEAAIAALDKFPTKRQRRVHPNEDGTFDAYIYTPRQPDVFIAAV